MSWVYSVAYAWERLWNGAVVPASQVVDVTGDGVGPISPTLDDIVIKGIDRTPENDAIEREKGRKVIIATAIAGVALGGAILIYSRRK